MRRLALVVFALGISGVVLLYVYAYSESLGIRGRLTLPEWLHDIVDQDELAYPVHVALGGALDWLGAPVDVSEEQWVKAAVHARTEADAEQVAGGLIAVWRRAPDPDRYGDRVCLKLRGVTRPATVAAVEKAGIHCDITAGRALPG